ncbi:transmembrane channel-like protein 4 isoform X2 [Tachyglossus aculeatus]|uniref:transmembrane channel-like protein 4 isoform X2 n=1 Tax=Tachyglossus aculeatus TaxID=9261 RepID=UPI0018F2A5BB|nr:transmembrane channel-like protein 4 isoform X2 [Tachyglossus aculeatus]
MEEESGRGGEARAVSWEPVARGPRPGQSLSTLLSQLPSVASVRYRGPVPGGPREEEWEAGGWAGGLVEEAPALQNPRELPWPMEAKRMFWRRLKAEQAGGQAPAGGQRGGWGLHQFRKAQVWTTDILQGVQPWRGDLLKIGGHFGSGTQAYFSLLRFLLLLNVLGALLPVTLVTLPTLLLGTGGGSQGSPSPSPPSPNSSLCGPYNPLPTGLVSYTEQLFNLLSGQGYLEWSVLFYGFYPKTDPGGYRLPLAYLLSAAGAGLLCLLLILHRSVGGLRQTLLAESGVLIRYSDRVFCGWDFCLADPKAVRLRHNTVRFEIQVELEEETVRQREAARTLTKRMGVWGVRALLNLLVLGLLGAAFYGVYWATQMSIQLQKDPQVSGDSFLKLLVDFLPSIFISAANLVLPPVLAGLTRLEGYTLSRQVLFILLRTVFLRIASLLVLLLTLWAKITCNGDPHAPSCKGCGYNSPELPATVWALPRCVGPAGGDPGVPGARRGAGAGLRADGGLDWQLLLSPPASDQHGQVCPALLPQEGGSLLRLLARLTHFPGFQRPLLLPPGDAAWAGAVGGARPLRRLCDPTLGGVRAVPKPDTHLGCGAASHRGTAPDRPESVFLPGDSGVCGPAVPPGQPPNVLHNGSFQFLQPAGSQAAEADRVGEPKQEATGAADSGTGLRGRKLSSSTPFPSSRL